MRKRMGCALMMTLCLSLTACGGGAGAGDTDELALDIRTEYLAMEGCTARMDVTADYGERVYTFTLDLSYEREGDATLTIVAPAEVAGVTARLSGEQTYLEYDGVSLETGPLDESGLSPMGAVPLMLRGAMEGFIAESGLETVGERSCLRMTCRDPEAPPGTGRELTLWFDTSTHDLVGGEILSDGVRIISGTVSSFARHSASGEGAAEEKTASKSE